MELLELPDDALVSVLQFVTPKDLLTCRLVCKRLAVLALHWDVWSLRKIEMYWGLMDAPLASALLHLVPCLQGVTVDERDIPALSKSKCAVADLTIVLGNDPDITMYCVEAIRTQEALGRLRHLHLIDDNVMYDDCDDDGPFEELAKAVLACCALVELEIKGDLLFTSCFHPVTQGPVSPFLKKFRCNIYDEKLPFITTVLARHGATLEEVILSRRNIDHDEDWYSATIPRLLGDMPHLSSLDCHIMPGLQVVADCTMLKKLCLYVKTWNLSILQDTTELLRRTKLLHEVQFHICTPPGITGLMISALSMSHSCPIVEHLELISVQYEEMRVLPLRLPSLPALRSLKVGEYRNPYKPPPDVLDKLLLAITPETVPALRSLEVSLNNFNCPHAWTHSPVVSEALAVNPLLHILMHETSTKFCCGQCIKCACTQCGKEVEDTNYWKFCIFSHDIRKCKSPYHSYVAGEPRQWIQICK